jgi:hypothetical protein
MLRNATTRRIVALALVTLALGFARVAGASVAPTVRRVDLAHATEAARLQQQHDVALRLKYDAIWEEARVKLHEARERAELVRRARRGDKSAIRALRVRRADDPEAMPADEPQPVSRGAIAPLAASATSAIPTNVRCNNPASDATGANAAGQAEESVAAIGNNVVVAWNNGQGFNIVNGDVQGYGWSNDGGATFTDGGAPLHPPAYPSFRWTSDPVMAVNEKTGTFYYCGLANTDATHNAIAVARGRFTAGTFAFDSVFIVRICLGTAQFLDKQWIACDSASGNVYVTNTTFGVYDTVDFYRSTDAGRSWSSPITLSSNTDAGYVQGSRVAVTPGGSVETVWYAADQATNDDNFRFRQSTDYGASFTSEVTVAKFYAQFGTGAPGFNRPRGINFPSLAVDRSTGPHRGRIYVGWQESFAFLNTALPPSGATGRAEVESNNTAATATSFTPGQTLSGQLTTTSSTRDLDYYSFPLSAGQNIIFSGVRSSTTGAYTMRVYAPDGTQMLCYGSVADSTTSSLYANVYYSTAAPVSGTYYLRLAATSWQAQNYTVYTAIGTRVSERGRDQRDAYVAYSDNSVTWSAPTRIDDDAVGYDLFLPELAVGNDGCVYARWFDHRDDTYGSRAHGYMTRSADGGATWAANQRITSAQSNFTTSPSNIAPNMGDYSGMTSSGTRIIPVWADGRLATGSGVDVWSTSLDVTSAISACASDTAMYAPGSATRGWTLANANALFGGSYGVALTSQRSWALPAPATVTIPAGGSVLYGADITVPDTAASGTNRICLTLTSPGGVVAAQCCYTITVHGQALGVGDRTGGDLALARSRPNPAFGSATIAFTLPRAGHARLTVYDLAGARVRTLLDGQRGAGEASVTWDGRDERGAGVRSGAYYYRLEFEGRALTQRLVLMR